MDIEKSKKFIEDNFETLFVTPLSDFVRIPNLTPAFDSEFYTNGLIEQAIEHVKNFAESLNIDGLEFHVHNEEGRAPMAVIVYPGNEKANIMVYGHLDKQPHMEGWLEGTSPVEPAIIDGKLYGRGSSDDGYVSFATLIAIKNAIDQGQELPRIAIVLEAEEESGSKDLIYLLDKCEKWIQKPDIAICCDSGALDYDSLWLTSSLRGMVACNLEVAIAQDASHSGMAGGIVPETFRLVNDLLNRLEDSETKTMPKFEVEIEDRFREEAKDVTELVGEDFYKEFKLLEGAKPLHHDNLPEMYLNVNWRPSMAITGADGLPNLSKAGNVVRASTAVRVSIRIPPSKDENEALEDMIKTLKEDPPYGAKVTVTDEIGGGGWVMKDLKDKTKNALHDASQDFYGKKAGLYGCGGSIPFLKTLGDKFPETEILAIGVIGPGCNIHAPNESIDLPYLKKFVPSLSHFLAKLA